MGRTSPLQKFIYKLGSNPQRSMRSFFLGLLLAALSGSFIALGYYREHWYQIIGLAIAIPAILLMAYGYIGIFANRFAQVIKPRKPREY